MATYIRAVKISETAESVTYRFGTDYEARKDGGTFTIPKLPPEQIASRTAGELHLNFCSARVFCKILRHYKENGAFPNAVSYQA